MHNMPRQRADPSAQAPRPRLSGKRIKSTRSHYSPEQRKPRSLPLRKLESQMQDETNAQQP